jgi:phosphoribosylformylglycinamidine synthase
LLIATPAAVAFLERLGGAEPQPALHVPFPAGQAHPKADPLAPAYGQEAAVIPEGAGDEEAPDGIELAAFGSSEFAKVILGGIWGRPPALDLDGEANLHRLLEALAARKLLHSARDISDGGIAVALAQSAFPLGIGARVEQDDSLQRHPLFGLFAEPASTVFVSAAPASVSDLEKLAAKHHIMTARIGTTGGNRLEISVDRETFISASVEELRRPWASALEANLHGEVSE